MGREVKGRPMGQQDKEQGSFHKAQKEQGVNLNSFVSGEKSYASSLSGKQQPGAFTKEVVVSEFAKAYVELHRKVIMEKTKDLWTLREMDILLKEAKFGESIIKYLGGLNVLVVFNSEVEADCFRSEAPGFGWFTSVEIWKAILSKAGNEVFDSVGRCFGKVVHASQRQLEDNFLITDSVCVLTDSVNRIEEVVSIVEEGKRFRIWVKEEMGDWIPESIENQEGQMEVEDVTNSDKSISDDFIGLNVNYPMSGDARKVNRFESEQNHRFDKTPVPVVDADSSRTSADVRVTGKVLPTTATNADKDNGKENSMPVDIFAVGEDTPASETTANKVSGLQNPAMVNVNLETKEFTAAKVTDTGRKKVAGFNGDLGPEDNYEEGEGNDF
ncbi:hypothetical protein HanHA89_Chr17g0697661 [Helianthus annuus]|nr:hypothetical protein HanHA89_Chr17g0697661 [Helianthus annuus]